MPNTLISVDLQRSPEEQSPRPHNRWHPDIPAVTAVEPGTVFRIECLDASGGQNLNSDSADDVRELDLGQMLYASGPIAVVGARPGDLLVVDVLDIGPLAGAEWGYTVLLDRSSGAGLLAGEYPEARKAIWDLNGVFASSRHIEGVQLTGQPHPGLIGCAPSAEMLSRWTARAQSITQSSQAYLGRTASAAATEGALLGHVPAQHFERVAREAASTQVAQENGGSFNARDLTPGSRLYLPVFVAEANLSVGDLQFSQGEGKITGFGGVRMAGWIDLRVELIPDGVRRHRISSSMFERSPSGSGSCESLTFQGASVENGAQQGHGVQTAYAQAYRNAIRYLERFGYTGDQAYALLAAAPIHGRISCMVGPGNECCTLCVPTEIFDFEVGALSDAPSTPRGDLARPT